MEKGLVPFFVVHQQGIEPEPTVSRKYCLSLPNQVYSPMKTTSTDSRKAYVVPSLRVIDAMMEIAFLASNLEPIDGGDDPDIDW